MRSPPIRPASHRLKASIQSPSSPLPPADLPGLPGLPGLCPGGGIAGDAVVAGGVDTAIVVATTEVLLVTG